MIEYIYYPTIKLGSITIFTWGLLVAIGFLVGILLAARHGKKIGIKQDDVYGLCFYVLLGAIICSRLLYVITRPEIYLQDPLEIFKVWHGGMDFLGGLAGGIIAAYAFLKIKKLDLLTYFDLLTPYIALGHVFGRIGCILGDGGHLGKPTSLPWGIMYEGVARHPGAIYEMLALIILFAVLIKIRKKNPEKGILFFSYILGYGILRFFIDFLRADPTYYGLTGTQWALIAASAIAIYFMRKIKRGKKQENRNELTIQK